MTTSMPPSPTADSPIVQNLDSSALQQPSSPTSKAAIKNEKAYNKVLLKEAKGEEKKMKTAIKDGAHATKAEQKAAKQAHKAKKALDKAASKEYKLNKKFMTAQTKHEKALVELEKAKAKMELETSHHNTQLSLRDQKMEIVNSLRGPGSVSVA